MNSLPITNIYSFQFGVENKRYGNFLQASLNGDYQHTYLVSVGRPVDLGDENRQNITQSEFNKFTWHPSSIKSIEPVVESPKSDGFRCYCIDSILDFGLYQDYELGIVFALDPRYVSWCIQNIDGFAISELELLYQYGTLFKSETFAFSELMKESRPEIFDHFKSIKVLYERLGILNRSFRFNPEIEEINLSKKTK